MAARRKPIEKPIEQEDKPEHIEVKEELKHNLVIPDRMYERMHKIGNDEYWLRIIENHIEIMMTRYHQ